MVVRARIHESRAPIVSGQFEDSAKSGQQLFSSLSNRSRSFFPDFLFDFV